MNLLGSLEAVLVEDDEYGGGRDGEDQPHHDEHAVANQR